MLRFEVDVTASDHESRIIEGLAVPFGEIAQLGDAKYQFTEGSLRPARARTPLLMGHDTNRPVGVLMGLDDTAHGAVARFKIDRGPEGDLALEQAQSGSRAGLSIGAQIVAADSGEDGVRVVTQASLLEVSLCSIAAFSEAAVTSVTAQANVNDPEEPEEAPVETENHTEAQPEPIAAEQPSSIVIKAEAPKLPELGDFVKAMVKAERGDRQSQEIVRAALDVVETTDVPGVLPDVYTQQIIGLIPTLRTIADNVRRAPLPGTGLKVIKPLAGTLPVGNWIGYDADAPTNTPTVTTKELDVLYWAYGVAVSQSVVERSAPDFASYVFAQAAANYYNAVEAKLYEAIDDASSLAASTGIGAALAEVYAGVNQPADLILAAPDVFGNWIDQEGFLTFSEGNLSGAMSGSIAGVRVVSSGAVTAGKAYAMASNYVELRESNPMQLTAVNIGALQMEMGVVSFATVDVENADAIIELNFA